MKPNGAPFYITYMGEQVKVEYYKTGKKPVFHVHLPSKPIFVTCMELSGGDIAWTSVPQGRQVEAEAIGSFIGQALNRQGLPTPRQSSLF